MASNSQGIQQLLAAEKSAAEKVSAARKQKAKRLKQAKDEAVAEIEAYRKERETQFKKYEQQTLGSKDDMAITIDKDTAQQVIALSHRVNDKREEALESLLDIVYNIDATIHTNMEVNGTA